LARCAEDLDPQALHGTQEAGLDFSARQRVRVAYEVGKEL
jgi:hypothetical protein